jgi:phage terminase large subunit-like protein
MAKKKTNSKTRGEKNIEWIERYLRIPEGKFVGQKVELRSWQKKVIRGIYDSPTRRAIVSFGRKNAKTTLAAMLLLLHLVGREARPNSQLYSAALSRDQAALLFGLAAKMVRMSRELAHLVNVKEAAKELVCEGIGTRYRALSAEASTAYGLSPAFIVHDELGQVKGPHSKLYEALETATGAQDDPLSVVISTQAPTDADLLSLLIDDAKTEADPKTKLFLFEADIDADPFAVKTIKQANPAYGDFLNAEEVKAMAEAARRMPSREAEFRNLVLNQRVEASSPFVSRLLWQSCGGEVIDSFDGLEVYAGLDLSSVSDLTALVLIAKHQGVWHVKPTFWLPADGLAEKARTDRVQYDVWNEKGFLETTPGKTVDYEWVAVYLRNLFDTLNVRKVAFDSWNWTHLKPWLLKGGGFDEDQVEAHFVEFGQGFKSMAPALRTFETKLKNGQIAHGNHPVLAMCAMNAVVQVDPAENRKLVKNKSHGRIDGMVALAMALSVAVTEEEERAPEYQMIFV